MIFWLLLFLGLITYLILRRSVARITRTPIWLLWLVIMTPPAIWTVWALLGGDSESIPLVIAIAPFAISSILYWWLIQAGRKPPEPSGGDRPETASKPQVQLPNPQSLRPIDQQEEADLRDCFPWTVYYLQDIEYRPQAAICRGKLRADPDRAYRKISKNIEARFGDRFLVIFQEGLPDQPLFVLVPNPQKQRDRDTERQLSRPGLAVALVAITLFTTTAIGAEFAGLDPERVQADPSLLLQGLPYALALMAILGVHEGGHYLAAQWYKIRTTLPYFIPVPFFLGTFGAFIQMRSPMPNRKALFDVSIAGPLAGLVVTIPLLVWGLAHSEVVPLTEDASLVNFNALIPSFSLLMALLSKLTFGSELTARSAIDLHPVAIAGYLGLIVTAINLMPVGQLDGGHIVHAMFGQRTSILIGQVARLLMLVLSLLHPELLLWAILLFLMPIRDEPALNDITELDNQRDFWGLVALALLVAILLPAPSSLL